MKNKGLLIIAIIVILLIIVVMARRGKQSETPADNEQTPAEETTAKEVTEETPTVEDATTPETEVVGEGTLEGVPTDSTLVELEDELMKVDLTGTDPDLNSLDANSSAQ